MNGTTEQDEPMGLRAAKVDDLPKRCKRPKGEDGLTLKQRRFVEAYMGQANGNATEAARTAGYKGCYRTLQSIGSENLGKPIIARFIEEQTENDPLVASRRDRQQLLTAVMNDPEQATRDRLKAVELLGKMQGDFTERREVVGEVEHRHRHQHRVAMDLSRLSSEELRVLEKVVGGVEEGSS